MDSLKAADGVTIGRIVVYRSRTGGWSVPAIIAATADTLNLELVERGLCPPIGEPSSVHLVVFSPGLPVMRERAVDFEPGPYGRDDNAGGTFREWDIPFDGNPGADQLPGTWRWPTRSPGPPVHA